MLELLGFHSVFPASAGMIPRRGQARPVSLGVPRKREDDSSGGAGLPAGGAGRVPRKRGDDPLDTLRVFKISECSPRARG